MGSSVEQVWILRAVGHFLDKATSTRYSSVWSSKIQCMNFNSTYRAKHCFNQISFCNSRLLMKRVAPLFTAKGLEFKVEYVNNIRDWPKALPNISSMYGAYRRRSVRDTDIIPHSFTFIRRERPSDSLRDLFLVFCKSAWFFSGKEQHNSWFYDIYKINIYMIYIYI